EINELCCKILEKLSSLDLCIETMDKSETFYLLLNIIKNNNTLKDKYSACLCLNQIAQKKYGCNILLNQRLLVYDLINVIQEIQDDNILNIILDTLRLLAGTPNGREVASKYDILEAS